MEGEGEASLRPVETESKLTLRTARLDVTTLLWPVNSASNPIDPRFETSISLPSSPASDPSSFPSTTSSSLRLACSWTLLVSLRVKSCRVLTLASTSKSLCAILITVLLLRRIREGDCCGEEDAE